MWLYDVGVQCGVGGMVWCGDGTLYMESYGVVCVVYCVCGSGMIWVSYHG